MRLNPFAAYRDHQAVKEIQALLLKMLRTAPPMSGVDVDEQSALAKGIIAQGGNVGLLSRAATGLVKRYPQLQLVRFAKTLMLSRTGELEGLSPDLRRSMRQTGALPTPGELEHDI